MSGEPFGPTILAVHAVLFVQSILAVHFTYLRV